ncbi:MAG TPA: ABC transporter ATP-binding protein [Tepidisphaeraceae bacterium]|jgi:ATP-binding cassette subfamily B protein
MRKEAQAPPAPPLPAPTVSNAQLTRWMFRFVRFAMPQAALACLYVAASIYVEIYTLNITSNAVNHVNELGNAHESTTLGLRAWFFSNAPGPLRLRYLILLMAAFVGLMLLLRYLKEVQVQRFSMRMVYSLREAVYDKIQRVGFGFHDAVSSGQLINRALSDLQNVRVFVNSSILLTLEIVLSVLGYMVLILTKSPWLALLAVFPLPFWTYYILRFSKKVQPVAKAVLEAEDRSVQIVTENIAGVHVVKAFATEDQEVEKYTQAAAAYQQRILARVRLFANFQPVIRSIASVSHLSLFFVAGLIIILARDGTGRGMAVGDLMILGGAMGAILMRLQQVSTINEQYQNAIVSARRLWEVIDAPPTVPEKPDAVTLPPRGTGEVRFENVSFGYGEGRPVLHDLTFTVPGGRIVAIVGPTGAGKSTLVNLISRFYDPRTGRILIDGVDLRDLRLSSLRTAVSFVFQETYLFSDTVAANIAYGRPNLSPGEIEAAARLSQAHDFIEALPQGYDSLLGERGANLSGGQRQRLAIARAIVTNPRVLILDDATAAIDPETEDLIRRGMRLTLFGRTTFVIAHRISTVKNADLVLVIEAGRITQMGTHDELMRQHGHYREIAAAQLSDDAAPVEERSHMRRVQDRAMVNAAQQHVGHTQQEEVSETP